MESKWVANIIEKYIQNGSLIVIVEYTKTDCPPVRDEFRTDQAQDADWPVTLIKRKLDSMNEIPAMLENISIGQIDTNTPVNTQPLTTEAIEYKKDIDTFNKYIDVSRTGIDIQSIQDFQDVKQRLNDNFLPEYLEFF